MKPKQKKVRKVDSITYKERAEWLSIHYPHQRDMYDAIARFFGEKEIMPNTK